MPPRQDQLRKLLERTPGDAFLVYALAMEHKKAGELDEALRLLSRTTELDANYAYAHFQRGQILQGRGELPAAREAFTAGVAAAERAGDAKGAGEIAGALAAMP
jgi:tetratricopeptide (TPR) repeat protein